MTKLHNEITINAPIEKIWKLLADVGELDKYDPLVQKATVTSSSPTGIGASRKVAMKDGKHWFEEKTTICKQNETLEFELVDCNFPIDNLKHKYRFERIGDQIKVMQIMEYEPKYGFFGKLMDVLMLRRQTDKGIKEFFQGLKEYAEKR